MANALAGVGKTISTVGGRTGKVGWGILSRLKMSLIILVFLLMVINAVMIGIETGDPDESVKYLGNKFLLTTQELDIASLEIIERGGVVIEGETWWKATWAYIKAFYVFFEIFFLIYIWIKVLGFVITKYVIWDDSKSGVGQNLGVMAFFFIQVLAIAISSGGETSLKMPFVAFWHFIQAMPYLIKPAVAVMERFTS